MTDKNTHHTHIRKVQTQIDKVGKGFCLAKWYHVSMHLHTGVNHSCYHPSPHKIPLEEIKIDVSALHNTNWKKEQRKLMLEGKRPSECSYCWDIEDLPGNNISDRHLRSSEDWALPRLEEAISTPWNENVYPSYLELNFGYECQFKCSYCSPSVSSSWFSEMKKYGDWPLSNPVNVKQYSIDAYREPDSFYKKEDENPYIDAFWEWFPKAYPHVKVLRFTGGEPLLSPNVAKVIDYIKDHPRSDLEFAINSNMGVPRRNLDRFINQVNDLQKENKIKKITLFTSVDTWGEQAEWIRNGLDIAQYEENLHYYMQNTHNANFSFMITFCLLSIPRFNLLLDKILELRQRYNTDTRVNIRFDTPYMLEPPHLTALIADDWFISRLHSHLTYMLSLVDDNDINKFTTVEYLKFKRVVEWIETNRYQDQELIVNRRDFATFIDEHDSRRETDWHKVFPELEDFYNKCR